MSVVLVVADDPINAALAKAVLGRAGHHVILTNHLKTVLGVVRDARPELVLVDVSPMGRGVGPDLCRSLRSDPSTASIPLLVVAEGANESATAAEHATTIAYLRKPFSTARLEASVQRLIGEQPA